MNTLTKLWYQIKRIYEIINNKLFYKIRLFHK